MVFHAKSTPLIAGVGLAAVVSAFMLLLVAGAIVAHAQSSISSSANSQPQQACTGLGTPQEDGDCQGTGQFGDQAGPDVEAAGATEIDS